MKKYLLSITVALALLIIPFSANAKPKNMYSSYYNHYHTVKLTKRVGFSKIKVVYPMYKSQRVAVKWLNKGTKVKVRNGGASWQWFAKGHGMKNTSKYFWEIGIPNTNWFK